MKPISQAYHLSVENVLAIHEQSIHHFGGSPGIRSVELLESALGATQASYGGTSVFKDLIEVAAAYLFYLCSNHPFIDGNKRTALASCIVFLKLNQIETTPDSPEWEALALDVASSVIKRDEVATRLRELLGFG